MMPSDDWEIYVVDRDGSDETRVTREIQHDLLPQFLDRDRLVGVIGEARHRRSFLYDLADRLRGRGSSTTTRSARSRRSTRGRRRRTARKLLIVAERDGDTVSPERGVYLMDLAREGDAPTSVRARVAANLAAERGAARERQAAVRADRGGGEDGGRRGLGRRAIYALREGALRLRLEARHAGRATSSRRRVPLRDVQVVRLQPGVPVVRSRATALGGQHRQRRRDAQGHGESRAGLRRQQPLRLGRDRPGRRRRHVGDGGAARDGADPGRAPACRRRSSSRRSPARRPGCSAAASSCAARSPSKMTDRRRAQQRHDRLGERPAARQHDPLLEPRHPRHPARRGDAVHAT